MSGLMLLLLMTSACHNSADSTISDSQLVLDPEESTNLTSGDVSGEDLTNTEETDLTHASIPTTAYEVAIWLRTGELGAAGSENNGGW